MTFMEQVKRVTRWAGKSIDVAARYKSQSKIALFSMGSALLEKMRASQFAADCRDIVELEKKRLSARVDKEVAAAAEASAKATDAKKSDAMKAADERARNAEAAKTEAEAQKLRAEGEAAKIEAQAKAIEALGDAISKIKQAGGDVYFDTENLGALAQGLVLPAPEDEVDDEPEAMEE